MLLSFRGYIPQSYLRNITRAISIMKYQHFLASASLPTLALGFPSMMGASKEEMLRTLKERAPDTAQDLQDRDLLSSTVGGLTSAANQVLSDVQGLLGKSGISWVSQ